MAIRSRLTGLDVTAQYNMHPTLFKLFQETLQIGAIVNRDEFLTEYMPRYETRLTEIDGKIISLRPAWTAYSTSPKTHVIIIGHILFIHTDRKEWRYQQNDNWFYQPSTRLFSDEPRVRMKQFQQLLERLHAATKPEKKQNYVSYA